LGANQLKNGPAPGEGGAPRKPIDLDIVRRAASIGCTNGEIGALLNMCERTFYYHLEQDEGLQSIVDQARETGRATLRRVQWQRAMAGDGTMLVWLGKNMLGQRDRHELSGADGAPLMIVTGVIRSLDDAGKAPITIDADAPDAEGTDPDAEAAD
jgi:hypothetical protein